jgi:Ca2+-binding EF-hand superfamily protein
MREIRRDCGGAAVMSWTKPFFVVVWIACGFLAGCSGEPPPPPDYNDPALLVKGSEIFQPIEWGEPSHFYTLDVNRDTELELSEFRVKMLREGNRQRAARTFDLLDTNDDDRLDMEEFSRRPGDAMVVGLDEDESGALSINEFAATRPALKESGRMGAFFAAWDLDNDKELSAEELEVVPFVAPFFEKDRDGDERISPSEFATGGSGPALRSKRGRGFRHHDLDGDGSLTMRELLYLPEDGKFWAMDTDGNGVVNSAEFAASRYAKESKESDDATDLLASMDRNSDSRLSIDEYRQRGEEVAEIFGSPLPFWLGDPAKELARLDRNGNGELVPGELYDDEAVAEVAEKFGREFSMLDVNRNGRVDLGEFSDRNGRFEFPMIDRNRDGKLSKGEYLDAEPPWFTQKRIAAMFSAADLDGDSRLSLKEYEAREAATAFLHRDGDEDGRVSLEEFGQVHPELVAAGRIAAAFRSHDVDGDESLTSDEFSREPWLVRFFTVDKNGNSQLEMAEFVSTGDKRLAESRRKNFDVRDQDGNGRISLREFFWQPEMAAFWGMDADRDGLVSFEEFEEADRFAHVGPVAATIFKTLDPNRNGQCELLEYATRSHGMILVELDRDQDSSLSFEEFSAFGFVLPGVARRIFGLADQDSDGLLTQAEFETRLAVEPVFEEQDEGTLLSRLAFVAMDENGDSRLVLGELSSKDRKKQLGDYVSDAHAAVDTNRDGSLSFDEFESGYGQLEFLAWDHDRSGLLDPHEFHVGVVPWVSPRRSAHAFSALDRNKDSWVDLDESRGTGGLGLFLDCDRDEDGVVTLLEFGQAQYASMEKKQLAAIFAAYDLDGDQQLVPAEMRESPLVEVFLAKDGNADRQLALPEFLSDLTGAKGIVERAREFSRLDISGDEFITLREFFFTPQSAKFWAMDTSGDMIVDGQEFAAAGCTQCFGDHEAALSVLDRNANGLLDIDEFLRRERDVSVAFGLRAPVLAVDVDDPFGSLDGNGDGALSPVEYRRGELPWATDSYATNVFAAIDSDGNQKLSTAEFRDRHEKCGFMLIDWDEDGMVSFEEFAHAGTRDKAAARAVFAQKDSDASGKLSSDEFKQSEGQSSQ